MASWSEIHQLQFDPEGARFLAELKLKYSYEGLTPWEVRFLTDLVARTDLDSLSARQAETLLEIRDKVERVSKVGTFSVRLLIQRCYEARNDLSEDDEAWIVDVRAEVPDKIRRSEARRLARCARQLGFIEGYVEI